MKANTEWLDTIGAYARSLEDIALFRAALMAIPHRADREARRRRRASRSASRRTRTSCSRKASRRSRTRPRRLAQGAARKVDEIAHAAEMFDDARGPAHAQRLRGRRAPRADEARRFYDLLSQELPGGQDRGRARSSTTRPGSPPASCGERGRAAVDAMFADIDAILTAPAPGEAPLGLERTGNATFNLLWTYLWMPCVTLPFGRGPNGLPVGIQLVGRQHEDAAPARHRRLGAGSAAMKPTQRRPKRSRRSRRARSPRRRWCGPASTASPSASRR